MSDSKSGKALEEINGGSSLSARTNGLWSRTRGAVLSLVMWMLWKLPLPWTQRKLVEKARTQIDSESRQRRWDCETGKSPRPPGKDILLWRRDELPDECHVGLLAFENLVNDSWMTWSFQWTSCMIQYFKIECFMNCCTNFDACLLMFLSSDILMLKLLERNSCNFWLLMPCNLHPSTMAKFKLGCWRECEASGAITFDLTVSQLFKTSSSNRRLNWGALI